MARIRTIKPEFPHSESMGRVSRDARLLFVLLWTICDDAGRARAASRMLASLLFPYDDDAPKKMDGWLRELQRERCIWFYDADGSKYLQVSKWLNHQKIDKPSGAKCPPPDPDSHTPRESSRDSIEGSGEDLDRDHDLEEGPRPRPGGEPEGGKASKPKRTPRKLMTLIPDDWTPRPQEREQAKLAGIEVDREAEAMRDWAVAKGERCLDWDARFRNWLRRAASQPANGNGTRKRETIFDVLRREEAAKIAKEATAS